jgi:hypothetical protein
MAVLMMTSLRMKGCQGRWSALRGRSARVILRVSFVIGVARVETAEFETEIAVAPAQGPGEESAKAPDGFGIDMYASDATGA